MKDELLAVFTELKEAVYQVSLWFDNREQQTQNKSDLTARELYLSTDEELPGWKLLALHSIASRLRNLGLMMYGYKSQCVEG